MEDIGRFNAMVKRTLLKLSSTDSFEVSRSKNAIKEYFELLENLKKVFELCSFEEAEVKEEVEKKFESGPSQESEKFDFEIFKEANKKNKKNK